ncbi:hypothetical protein ACOZB4_17695, partial [Paenibacillus sp. NPDC058898]|uniref:hypothetical protein n=1 Tax=Paenibacillus sp. NPDC058898 TaxID=3346669 RepID=UPI003BF46E61
MLEGIVCGIFCWRAGRGSLWGEAEDGGGRYWVTSVLCQSVGGPAVSDRRSAIFAIRTVLRELSDTRSVKLRISALAQSVGAAVSDLRSAIFAIGTILRGLSDT